MTEAATTPDKTTTVTASPAGAVATVTTKSSMWSTEHVLAYVATLLSLLVGSGVIPTSGVVAQVVTIASAVLVSLGYTVGRSMVKAAA